MTYIPSSGGSGGGTPVAFDANDLYCWQTVETTGATSWPNRVPGGASATLSMTGPSAYNGPGAPAIVNPSTERSFYTSQVYPTECPRGAPTANPPTNDFTIDWYYMPVGRNETSAQDHWVWQKRRVTPAWNDLDASAGMVVRYSATPSTSLLEWECRVRLTSGNVCRYGTNVFQYGGPPGFKLSPHVWYHMGFTVSLDGGGTTTSLKMFLNGRQCYPNDNTPTTDVAIVGTAVDWNSSFDWEMFGRFGGTYNHCAGQGSLQRLRVSNVGRPASYFVEAAKALR